MITELSAALTAIRETFGLAKVINDAKTDAEVKAATSELQARLFMLQTECISLGEIVSLKEEKIVRLKEKIAEYENFERESVGYVLNQTEAGSFVYSKQLPVNDSQLVVNVCANCFHKRKISILQPAVEKAAKGSYFIHFCPSCNSEFKMNKVPKSEPAPRRTDVNRWLSGGGGW
ncbi:hypothetical protein [Escherichia coli]|uniref:hypothetical protein n=1 Tax=Escherichia coli TaxID=562 RepID=UPI001CD03D76|nr:hypothetical protein [Escherichia coli]EIY3404549.1 hypothetical protein [Escherichia coli]MDM8858376.1 hypothetical protein [Escherichia coli]MDM8863761.1 hypothetical protein [Escherichia coli]MDM8868134.1 hypothetical protein [Escherichia coli]WJW20565.1 hypothetical protein QVM98_12090 [Escherichia coli]